MNKKKYRITCDYCSKLVGIVFIDLNERDITFSDWLYWSDDQEAVDHFLRDAGLLEYLGRDDDVTDTEKEKEDEETNCISLSQQDMLRVVSFFDTKQYKEIYEIESEIIPFFCINCNKNYCATHWRNREHIDEDDFEFTRARCPNGHTRLIENR